ncbi:MAG: hypothetical protein ACRCUT_05440, partial [Spirochaetota bacterium]
MARKISFLVIVLLLAFPALAQNKKEPVAGEKARYLDELISQNYINIRDLRPAVLNYGGGQHQFTLLLDGFSAAFAKYLSEQMDEASRLFEKNDADINAVASELAKKYQKDTDELYNQLIKTALKDKMGKSVTRNAVEIEMDLTSSNDFYLKSAAHLLRIGDQRITEKKPMEAIFYYRKCKQYIFQSYDE